MVPGRPAVTAVRVPCRLLRAAVAGLSADERDETAVPSYCHWNPLVRWVFWRRLEVALALAGLAPGDVVVDYGTGSGVLVPSLVPLAVRVVVVDLHLGPPRALCAALGLQAELVPADGLSPWASEHAGRIDCIFALDVLEHVDERELPELLGRFRSLLGGRGRLVASGPTETPAYRVARRLAGFHGHYHRRSIRDIDALLRRDWRLERAVRVPGRPLPQGFLVGRYVPRAGA